jgi:hypothetical protein
MEGSTDPDKGQPSEAEECYNTQKKLEEEDLLARVPGEPGDEEVEVNPSLLDVSMDDATAKGNSEGPPNPTVGGAITVQSTNPIRGVEGSQSGVGGGRGARGGAWS